MIGALRAWALGSAIAFVGVASTVDAQTLYPPTPQPLPPSYPGTAYPPAIGYPQPVQPPSSPVAPVAPAPTELPAWPPAVLPYRDGQPIPKAYRLENHANSGLVIGGAATFVAGYATALIFAAGHDFNNGLSWTAAPVVGPYGAIGARSFNCYQTDPTSNKCLHSAVDEVKAVTFLAVDGMVQAVGVTLMVVGVADRDKELVRTDMPEASITPTVWVADTARPGNGWGIGFTGTF